MLRSTFRRTTSIRFNSSRTSNLFTDNFNLPQHENEINLIPKRPIIEPQNKIHVEMLSPEYISDLVIKPTFNDVFCTSLALRSPFSGDSSYKLVPKDKSEPPVTVELLFTNLTYKYMEVFQLQITPLKSLPSTHIVPVLVPTIQATLEFKFKQFSGDIREVSGLTNFGSNLISHNNSKDSYLDISKYVTIDNFCIFILDMIKDDDVVFFTSFITYMNTNLDAFSNEQYHRVLEKLILKLENIHDPIILNECCLLINQTVTRNSIAQLDPYFVDILARIFSRNSQTPGASRLIHRLIKTQGIQPSEQTITEYFELFAVESITKEEFIRRTGVLKPALYSMSLNKKIANIVIQHGIDCAYELDNFLSLILESRNNHLVTEIGNSMIHKMINIEGSSLQVSQLITRLLREGLKLDKSTQNKIVTYYEEIKDSSNSNYINSLSV